MNLTEQNRRSLQALCENHNIKSLSVFGSVLRTDFNKNSDIDFLVDIDDADPLSYADHYFDFKFAVEQLFGRSIDMLEERGLQNPLLRQQINATKVQIYG
jgi:predicted nucleotidyltransferase